MFTRICSEKSDDGVTTIGNRDGVLDRTLIQISIESAFFVKFDDCFSRDIRSEPFHPNHPKIVSVQVKRMICVVNKAWKMFQNEASKSERLTINVSSRTFVDEN